MGQFKRVQVVMLPGKKSEICLANNKLCKVDKSTYELSHIKTQHLYIISDDEIKEGDWIVKLSDNVIIKANSQSDYRHYIYKKIIAATDSSLLNPNINIKSPLYNILGEKFKSLPQPSQQFIERYIESYNKGEVITDVLVEYQEDRPYKDNEFVVFYDNVKINPKDNTITIKKIKDNWNREEVVELIKKFNKDCTGQPWFESDENWIEKNL